MKIRKLDGFAVYEPQASDTCSRQIERRWGAKPPKPNNKDARALESALPPPADQENLPGVPFEFRL
jgi:hypothetical protein